MDSGQHAAPKNSKIWLKLRNFVLSLAVVMGLAYVMSEYVAIAYAVPSSSMESTIHAGDKVYAEQLSYYFRDVEPGDIITFEDPSDPDKILLKRCVAVGGQSVDFKDGCLYVDDVLMTENYTEGKPTNPFVDTQEAIVYPYTLSEGQLWVMGDNRTNSKDSRYFGAIDTASVKKRVFIVLWPFERMGMIE